MKTTEKEKQRNNRETEQDQSAENMSVEKWNRRAFLGLGAAVAIGSLPLFAKSQTAVSGTTSQTAEATAPTVSQSPLPIVDARFPCRIADGIWIIPDKRIPLVPNIGIVEGSKAVLVIDCGLTPEFGRNVLNAARTIAGKRDLILTVTHAHPEHTFGAQAFKGNARIYYNKLQRDYLARDGAKLLKGFRSVLPPEAAYLLDDIQITLADDVYEGSRASIELGDRKVDLWTSGIAHSPGDQVIHIPDQKVTFAGDLIEERMFPIVPFFPPMIQATDINLRVWKTVLTEIAKQTPRIIVPGHGNLGGVEIADQVRDYLENTGKLAASAGAGKQTAADLVRRLEPVVRQQHPTWERTEYIAPALRYLAETAKN